MALSDELEALAKRHGALSYRKPQTRRTRPSVFGGGTCKPVPDPDHRNDGLIRQMRYALALPCDRWNQQSRASCAKQSTPQTRGWRQRNG